MILALCAQWALAADPLVDASTTWVHRAVDALTLDGQRPSAALIAISDRQVAAVEAEFGAIFSEQATRSRPARVEVVVGDDTLNSMRFKGAKSSASPYLPVEDVPLALARALWLATDTSFKAAVRTLEVKRAALAQLADASPPDRIPGPATSGALDATAPPPDLDGLRTRAIAASAAFRDAPALRTGTASAYAWDGRSLLVRSDGVTQTQPEGYAAFFLSCEALRSDGVPVAASQQWVARTVSELPAPDALAAAARALAAEVLARHGAPAVADYEGPVLFEGDAASQLLAQLAVPELLGTPPPPTGERTYAQLVRAGPRLGRHLLLPGWSVRDDAARDPLFPRWDREGNPTLAVDLVREGVVVDLLRTEAPRPERPGTTGHARGDVQGSASARPTWWRAAPTHLHTARGFDRAVDRARQSSGLDRILVVRALGRGAEGTLPAPTRAVWRYADGHEEAIAALEFQAANRHVLRDIAAATGSWTRTYLGGEGGSAPALRGLPTRSTTPQRLLVTTLEAVFPGGNTELPRVPMPPLVDP